MNKRIDRIKKRVLTPIAMLLFVATASAQNYYVLNLGVLPGQTDSFATGINASGTVVGSSGNRPFVFTKPCTMTPVGILVDGKASASAISKQGKIVGSSTSSFGRQRAFSYEGGVISDLGGPPDRDESATAISSWQIPVGVESIPAIPNARFAVYYYGGATHPLPQALVNPPNGYANIQNVTAVNDILEVTGFLDGSQIGFVSAPGFGPWTRIQGIPGNASQSVVPFAINENGHVVGGQGFPTPHAFLSANPNAPAVDLGTLNPADPNRISLAKGINVHDWIVGLSDSSPTSGPLAFLYNGSTMIDLNTRLLNGAGWVLKIATGINDDGLIIGNGTYNGFQRAFLLIPVGYPWDISRCNVVKGPPLF
jgi:probable HAF family extracellular repeat protein